MSRTGATNVGLAVSLSSHAAPSYPASGFVPVCGRDEQATDPSGRSTSTWPRDRSPSPNVSVHSGWAAACSMFGVATRLPTVAWSVATALPSSFAEVVAAKAASLFAVCRESRSVWTKT